MICEGWLSFGPGLSSCGVSAPMLELLSTCVLPTLPRYMLLWSLGPAGTLARGQLVAARQAASMYVSEGLCYIFVRSAMLDFTGVQLQSGMVSVAVASLGQPLSGPALFLVHPPRTLAPPV